MIPGCFWNFISVISKYCAAALVLTGLVAPVAQAERILDLRFWPADASSLGLGGLWEFHAQSLLEPAQWQRSSEMLLEISQPWSTFRPLHGPVEGGLEYGSYVLFVKGLEPRSEGYALNVNASESMARVIVSPKYAPGKSLRIQTAGAFTVFPWLRSLLGTRLKVNFAPHDVDEIWMIVIQRWQTDRHAVLGVPRLEVARRNN